MEDNNKPRIQPLDIPEIRIYLAQFLSKQSQIACIRVSRDWYASFQPQLWSSVRVVRGAGSPTLALAQANASFIRQLELRTHDPTWLVELTCPSLTHLCVSRPLRPSQAEILFIHRHKDTLRTLVVSSIQDRVGDQIWTTFAGCHRLESLTIRGAMIEPSQWPTVWKLWSRLKELSLSQGVYFRRNAAHSADTAMPWCDLSSSSPSTIQKLELTVRNGMTVPDQITLLGHCPALRSLTWSLPRGALSYQPLQSLVEFQSQEHSPGLVALHLHGEHYGENELLSFLNLRRDGPLIELSLKNGHFGIASWQVLQSTRLACLETLEVLHLRGCEDVTETMAQDMLCSLPKLKEFSAPRILSRDMEHDPRPWACRRSLLHLHLSFVLTSKESQRLVFSRLAELEQLQVLKFGRETGLDLIDDVIVAVRLPTEEGAFGVDLRLQHGLDLLAPLKELQEFTVEVEQKMGNQEIDWMVKNWPSLKIVQGELNAAPETAASLVQRLDMANINHTAYYQ
ncbi:hypothetical protein BGZ83_000588 [Gryganskiella cystojenkinii]|nr:hypothetical protein BGZ83_000588 [Gryganskiella cystojenkinii]